MKAGYRTTEFWLALVLVVLPVLVAGGVFSQAQADSLGELAVVVVGLLGAFGVGGVVTREYVKGRTALKMREGRTK